MKFRIAHKMFDGDLWNEARPRTKFEAWLDLLRLASEEGSPDLQVTTKSSLATRWGWSRKGVRSFLNYLVDRDSISITEDEGGIVIHLVNWTTYQEPAPDEFKMIGPDDTDPLPSRQEERVWETYCEERVKILKNLGRRVVRINLTPAKRRVIQAALRRHDVETVVCAIKGAKFNDWMMARGQWSSRTPRLSLEEWLKTSDRADRVEILADNFENNRGAEERVQVDDRDGEGMVEAGFVWSSYLGRPVPEDQWVPAEEMRRNQG